MNDRHNRIAFLYRLLESEDAGPPPQDDLDTLLREWHRENAEAAGAARERILSIAARQPFDERGPVLARIGRAFTGHGMRVAAAIALVGLIAVFFALPPRNEAQAGVINVPEGGELTALSADGDRLGPCPLQHTDVDAEVSGPVTRVTVQQRFANPYQQKIEAVYTFPLSHRSAVDRMRITVKGPSGERVVEGEVKERNLARQIYESAKASGYVASLLEQERPNIFTQSVANIEPGSTVVVEISYVEWLRRTDGVYSFDFPMTVGPRYIPGAPDTAAPGLPAGLEPRPGLVLLGPAEVAVTSNGSPFTSSGLQQMLAAARPIRTPSPAYYKSTDIAPNSTEFVVTYATGAKETGQVGADGTGHLNGRAFWFPGRASGAGFAPDTNLVPDASRITPTPVKPPERAGHDVSLRVHIDTGGPAVRDVTSALHDVTTSNDGGRTTIALKDQNTIPNRDFVLSWRTDGELIEQGVLSHVRNATDASQGGYVAVVLDPPARAKEDDIPPRELVFVLDTSGSMSGFPIEKAKEVMSKAISAMRPQDTFNVITFAGSTRVLWSAPRPATEQNEREAQQLVNAQQGGGGTEMMKAIDAALRSPDRAGWLKPADLVDLPADGRSVRVQTPMSDLNPAGDGIAYASGKVVPLELGVTLPTVADRTGRTLNLEGRWSTKRGDRVFVVDRASFERASVSPTRIVMFLTDGYVGNDQAILQAVRDNARTTRVFSFGVGNSVNRFLLDEMAREGRGVAEYVYLDSDADATVARFTRRIQNPVLVDIEASFAGVEVTDLLPDPAHIPDLYDEEPIVLVGRYTQPGKGTLTLRGRNGSGPWERTVAIDLPRAAADGRSNSSLPTLWARAKIDELVAPHRAAIEQQQVDPALRAQIVALGESYSIVTPFTSFVAVERGRVTVGGSPMLVQVPIELPEGTSWNGFFGDGVTPAAWYRQARGGLDTDANRRVADLLEGLQASGGENSLFFGEAFDKDVGGTLSDMPRGLSEAAPSSVNHLGVAVETRAPVSMPPGNAGTASAPTSNFFLARPSGGGGGGMGGGGFGRRVAPSIQAPGGPVTAGQPAPAPPAPPPPASSAAPAERVWSLKNDAAGEQRDDRKATEEKLKAAPPTKAEPSNMPVDPAKAGSGSTQARRAPGDQRAAPGGTGAPAPSGSDGSEKKPGAPADAPPGAPTVPPSAPAAGFGAPDAAPPGDASRDALREELDRSAAASGSGEAKTEQAERQSTLTPADRDILVRRLERRLLVVALAAQIDAAKAIELAGLASPKLEVDGEGTTRVTILLGSPGDDFAKAVTILRDRGLAIEAEDAATRIVVARVRIADLIRLALLHPVRRIEPFAARPATR